MLYYGFSERRAAALRVMTPVQNRPLEPGMPAATAMETSVTNPIPGSDPSPIARTEFDPSCQCAIVYVQGHLDETTAPAFRDSLYAGIESGWRDIIVELGSTRGVGSVGVGALLCAARRFGDERGRIVLANCSPAVGGLLEMAGVHTLFPLFADVDAARAALFTTVAQAFEPIPENSASLRRWLRERTAPLEMTPTERDAIEAAASEAFNNAVEHASPQKSSLVTARVYIGSSFTVELEDEGPGFEARQYFAVDPESLPIDNIGLGIHVMRNLMDRVEFIAGEAGTTESPAGTTVRLVKRLLAVPARKKVK
ncbi:MAG: ATP-binding protein [Chloroflexi bacterium]|nr:ATP-binding protein [Chloroflexota bacterium]